MAGNAEAVELSAVASTLAEADLGRPSPCPPWTVGDLFCHVLIAVGRIAEVLAEPANGTAEAALIRTRDYYRRDQRFAAATNADRIETARALSARLRSATAISAELTRRWQDAARLLTAAPPDQVIRTRHGDRMLLADFACTRIVELGVHGLDLAAGLDLQPWLTDQAADVLEDLLLPAGGAAVLQAQLGCDRPGLVARLTGRAELSPTETALIRDAGAARLALG